jgi:G3E family GTPase
MINTLFISGFLGAGKTTLLNALLRHYQHLRIGVIVNDFGDIAIDNQLIEQEAVAGEIKELRSGQIFCSCLSGSFIDSVLAFQEISPDLLVVECSGLAKPASLRDIVSVIEKKAPEHFHCLGMVSLVDATRHAILEQSLMVITEQLEASDILLLSKLDAVSAEEKERLSTDLKDKFPGKLLFPFNGSELNEDILDLLLPNDAAYSTIESGRFSGWGKAGRPKTFTLTLAKQPLDQLLDRLQPYQKRWYRLKGVIETTDKGLCFLDGTEKGVVATPADRHRVTGLVCITHDADLEREIKEALEDDIN